MIVGEIGRARQACRRVLVWVLTEFENTGVVIRSEREKIMERQVRRVVTNHEADGKAVVLFDGAPAKIGGRPETGVKSWLLWVTDTTPADVSGPQDRADRTIGIPPPAGGSVFRIVDFYPIDDTKLPPDQMVREMGTDHAPSKAWPPRHPAMHRTRSIDYAIVLSGEIDMLLDDSEIHLKAGDVLIQQATNHAWVNRGIEPCRIAFVLIDAKDS
jgi:mannose-6-phosphate isomerase-like protein (cupin superfamily)